MSKTDKRIATLRNKLDIIDAKIGSVRTSAQRKIDKLESEADAISFHLSQIENQKQKEEKKS